jgi:beta-galactosidase
MTVDVVPPTADLGGYDAVVAPTLSLAEADLADALESYAGDGGELLLTMRSGVKDRHNRLHDAPQPGPLRELVGARVEEHESVPAALESRVVLDGDRFDCRVWNEWLAPADATVAGRYEGGRADGRPAVVHDEVGTGGVTHVGTWPGDALAGGLVGDLLDRAGVAASGPFPPQVRATRRDGLTWIANFRAEPPALSAPADADRLLGGDEVGPYDVAITDATPAELTVDGT